MFIWCLECIVCVETLLSLKRQICMSGGHIEVIKTCWPSPLLAGLTYIYLDQLQVQLLGAFRLVEGHGLPQLLHLEGGESGRWRKGGGSGQELC